MHIIKAANQYLFIVQGINIPMLKKIQGILHAKEGLDEVKQDLASVRSSIGKDIGEMKLLLAELSGAWEAAYKALQGHADTSLKVQQDLATGLRTVQELKESFESELNELRMLKSRMHKTLLEDLKGEFKDEIASVRTSLVLESGSLNQLRAEVLSMGTQINAIKPEITKFTEISQHIKKADFDLNKYALRLDEANRDKLELLRKIDTLQKLISKERRLRS